MNFEDDLRRRLHSRVESVDAAPDPEGLLERSGRAARRRTQTLVLLGVAAALLVGAAGVAGGSALAGTSSNSSATPAPSPGGQSPRAFSGPDAAVAPGGAALGGASTTIPTQPLTPLFTRTTAGGVTIRAYSSAVPVPTGPVSPTPPTPTTPTTVSPVPPVTTPTTGCPGANACSPGTTICRVTGSGAVTCPVPVTCPSNALCAQPQAVQPKSVPAQTSTPGAGTTPTAGSGASGGPVTTVPAPAPASCPEESVTVELSTDAAVGTDQVTLPSSPGTPAGAVVVAGSGSFGVAEGSPTGWVLVSAGPDVDTVRVTQGDGSDEMAPVDGLAVLALAGTGDLGGATVDGLDASGNVVSSVSVPSAGTAGPLACPSTSTTVPPVSTPTVPPTTGPPASTTTVPPTSTTTVTGGSTTTTPTTGTVPTTSPRVITPAPAIEPPATSGGAPSSAQRSS